MTVKIMNHTDTTKTRAVAQILAFEQQRMTASKHSNQNFTTKHIVPYTEGCSLTLQVQGRACISSLLRAVWVLRVQKVFLLSEEVTTISQKTNLKWIKALDSSLVLLFEFCTKLVDQSSAALNLSTNFYHQNHNTLCTAVNGFPSFLSVHQVSRLKSFSLYQSVAMQATC